MHGKTVKTTALSVSSSSYCIYIFTSESTVITRSSVSWSSFSPSSHWCDLSHWSTSEKGSRLLDPYEATKQFSPSTVAPDVRPDQIAKPPASDRVLRLSERSTVVQGSNRPVANMAVMRSSHSLPHLHQLIVQLTDPTASNPWQINSWINKDLIKP